MQVLAVVPARGGSKGIPLKNLAPVAGRPLLAWTLAAARDCAGIALTVVSTDHPEIAACARDQGAAVIDRPAELSRDETPTGPVLEHALAWARAHGYAPDAILTLQPTSPLREARHLEEAIALFARHPEADSLVSVQRAPHQFAPESLMRVEGVWAEPLVPAGPQRRQDKSAYWGRNGAAIYLTRSERLSDYIWGGRTLAFPMDKLASIDVDDADDLAIADALLRARTATFDGEAR